MKTILRLEEHAVVGGDVGVVEAWNDGVFIGAVYGADGSGVRIITKHPVEVTTIREGLNVVEVKIDAA